MPVRHFFRKAHPPPKPPRPKPPDHKGKILILKLKNGRYRTITSAQLSRLQGSVKAGRKKQQGKGFGFTPETARKAALKLWATRHRMIKRIGRRVGQKSKRRSPVMRAPLRILYTDHPTSPIVYEAATRTWRTKGGSVIGERAALRTLGHLPRVSKTDFHPSDIVEIVAVVHQGQPGNHLAPQGNIPLPESPTKDTHS